MGKKATFDLAVSGIEFKTKANGDRIIMHGMVLNAETAADLAYIINDDGMLEVTIKHKGD